MRRLWFEARLTFGFLHLVPLVVAGAALLPGVLRDAGLSPSRVVALQELALPLLAGLLAAELLGPELRSRALERVATCRQGLRSVALLRVAILAGYLVMITGGMSVASLAALDRLDQAPAATLSSLAPALALVGLSMGALAATGSPASAFAAPTLAWGAGLVLTVFPAAPWLAWLLPFGYFANHPPPAVWFGKGVWLLAGACAMAYALAVLERPESLLQDE